MSSIIHNLAALVWPFLSVEVSLRINGSVEPSQIPIAITLLHLKERCVLRAFLLGLLLRHDTWSFNLFYPPKDILHRIFADI